MSRIARLTTAVVAQLVLAATFAGTASANGSQAPFTEAHFYKALSAKQADENFCVKENGVKVCARPGKPVVECTSQGCVEFTPSGPRPVPEVANAAAFFIPLGIAALKGGVTVGKYIARKRIQKRLARELAERNARRAAAPIVRSGKSINRGGTKAVKRVLRRVGSESARTVVHCFVAGIGVYLFEKNRDKAIAACVGAAALRFVK